LATIVHKWREEIARDQKKRRRVMLAGNLAHCLQKALGTKTMREA
jgi:hypothetical protein